MKSVFCAALAVLAFASTASARVIPFPREFHAQQMQVTGGTEYVRVGGRGPAVLLLHGFGDSGDMWAPLAARLVADHTVIVPDLRGMGLSSIVVVKWDPAKKNWSTVSDIGGKARK